MAQTKRKAENPAQKVTVKPVPQGKYVLPFNKSNYRLTLIGLAIIILGLILMVGGGSDDPNVYNPDIFSFQRLTLAPLLMVAGFIVEIFAIMRKPKEQQE